MNFRRCLAVAFFASLSTGIRAEEAGEAALESSLEFLEAEESAFAQLLGTNFFDRIALPGFGARLDDSEVDELLARIDGVGVSEAYTGRSYFGPGNSSEVYDVVLQPGHYLRSTGRTGAVGTRVLERDLAAEIVFAVADLLVSWNIDVLVVAADNYQSPLNTTMFLAVHLDGGDPACSSSPSMGYDDNTDVLGVHTIGFALAAALDYSYNDFMADGFTANLREYYAFDQVNASSFEGIIELGEITCAAEEDIILRSQPDIVNNFAEAIRVMLTMLAQ